MSKVYLDSAPSLLQALYAVLGSALTERRNEHGEVTHDWRTCQEFSCTLAREAINKATADRRH